MSVRWMTIGGDIDNDLLIEEIEAYIASKHTTLWGKQSSVFESKGLREMSAWLADVINEVVQQPAVQGA